MMNFQQSDSTRSDEILKSERNSSYASYQGSEAQINTAANDAAPPFERRGRSTSKASTGRDKCGYCTKTQYEDAAWFCMAKGVIDLKTRLGRPGIPGYTKVVWDVQAKAHEIGDEEWGVSFARELAEAGAVGNFEEADFLKVVDDFKSEKSKGGLLPTLAWNNGWEKPGLNEDERQEAVWRNYSNADEKIISPYLKSRGYLANPHNVRTDKYGNTWVQIQGICPDEYDCYDNGCIKIFWDERQSKWEKYNQGPSGRKVWAEFRILDSHYKASGGKWLLFEFPDGVCDTRVVYKTERLLIAEGLCTALAISASYRDQGKGYRFDDRSDAVLSVGSCYGFDSVVEGIRKVRDDIEIVLIADREPSGAGIGRVAELCRKYRDIKVVDPRWVSDRDKVDVDDIRASSGAGAVVSLVERARTLTDAEIEEILGSEKSEYILDNDSQSGVWRQKRQKTSYGRVGSEVPSMAALGAFEGGADQVDIDGLPVLVRGSIEGLASDLGLKGGASELCARIGFDFAKFHAVEGAMAFQQKDRRHQIVTERGELRTFAAKEVGLGVRLALGHFYSDARLTALLEKCVTGKEAATFIKYRKSVIHDALILHILNNRQFVDMAVEVSMFDAAAKSTIKDGRLHVSIPHVPFDESIGSDIPEDERGRIVADYRQHWALADEFIALLVACRFAAARKKAYLWLRAPSDWGKGLLCSVLDRLGLITDLTTQELERLGSGQPVGLQVGDFLRSWCLCFNEFRSAKTELKTLEQSARFSPKGLPQVTVPLYLKLFLSAEHVESLASTSSGAEDQFCNRFSLVEPEGGRIDDRPLFRENRGRYLDALAGYIATELNRQVAEYVALGQREAAAKADAFVAAFHSRHGLGNRFTRLSEKVPELCEEFLEWLVLNWAEGRTKVNGSLQGLKSLTRHERLLYEHGFTKDEPCEEGYKLTNVLYVRSPQKLLKEWLESEFNRAEAGKLVWKGADFTKCLPEVTRVRFGGSAVKVMRVGCYGPTWG